MRRIVSAVSFTAFTLALAPSPLAAQTKETTKASAPANTAAPASTAIKDLSMHKVVLYKNGVGYFEHAGTVSGNQRVTIDFTSPQLNDVLQ